MKCTTCEKVFVENKGRAFYGRHHGPEDILECPATVAGSSRLASIHGIKGVKEVTVMSWLCEASNHVEGIESSPLSNYPLTRVLLGAMGATKGIKRIFQRT